MRNICGLVLIIMTAALSGCVNSTFDNLTSLQNGCSVSATSVACTSPTGIVTTPTTPTTPTSPSGAPIVNTGNNTTLTTGDTTIALESSVNTTLYGAAPAISTLLNAPANAPSTANQQIWFNTNTATNGLWPVSKTMTYSDFDTCQTETAVSTLGGINAGPVRTTNNVDPNNPGKCTSGLGGQGLNGNYKAYRSYQPQTGFDEELQVWAWNNSYATQYRDVTASGTAPQHQAWSFGGNYTTAANMPIGNVPVIYNGKWTATATTANFIPASGSTTVVDLSGAAATKTIAQTVAPSNTWRVDGTSVLTAYFSTGKLTGRLSSTNWQGVDNTNNFTNVDPIDAQSYATSCVALGVLTCATNTQPEQDRLQNWYNWRQEFMSSDVVLAGDITKSTTNIAKPNQVVGTAVMDPNNGWITDTTSNPMFAGFFGPTGGAPTEVTGTFALRATTTSPNSGNAGINNDRRGTIEMSGIFNGQ